MSIILRLALIVITLIYLIVIVTSVKRRKLQASFSIFWIITGLLLIIAIIIPNFIEMISAFLGFENTSNMIFCITIFVAFYLIFDLTILLSKTFKRDIDLVQEVSMLKKKVEDLEEKIKKVGG